MADSKTEKRGLARRILRIVLVIVLVLVILFVAFIVVANVYTVTTTRDDVRTVAALENEDADAIIVLGASVYADGTPSDMLAHRLEVAVDLYNAGAASKILVSGDGRDSHYDEPDAMKAYCVDLGVPEDDVLVDHEGYDTYASIYRAQSIFGIEDAVVVTQAYHLYRALAIAQGLGMEVFGVAADKGTYENQLIYSIREIGARAKDFAEVLVHAEPAVAGDP